MMFLGGFMFLSVSDVSSFPIFPSVSHSSPLPLSSQGVLYPMSAFNLAFNREAIGPAMYFPPVADGQPIGFHDDMWAGWCSKVGVRERRRSIALQAQT